MYVKKVFFIKNTTAIHTRITGPHRGSVIIVIITDIIPNSVERLVGNVLDIMMTLLMGNVNSSSVDKGYTASNHFISIVFDLKDCSL